MAVKKNSNICVVHGPPLEVKGKYAKTWKYREFFVCTIYKSFMMQKKSAQQ